MEWVVYVLWSEKWLRTYVGYTGDLRRRLMEHNAGRVRATQGGRPWQVIYIEAAAGEREARRRERYYKSASGRRKLRGVVGRRGGRVD